MPFYSLISTGSHTKLKDIDFILPVTVFYKIFAAICVVAVFLGK
jgi:hypothetical protein